MAEAQLVGDRVWRLPDQELLDLAEMSRAVFPEVLHMGMQGVILGSGAQHRGMTHR